MSSTIDDMTFGEAVGLADRIRTDHPELRVRAVGVFVPPEELRAGCDRWGVSVLMPSGQTTVFWSSLSFAMAAAPADKKRPSKPKPKAQSTAHDERQAVLF